MNAPVISETLSSFQVVPDGVLVLDDARGKDVERHVRRRDRVVRVVVARAQCPSVVHRPLDAELPDVDVLPAEPGTGVAAEAVAAQARTAKGGWQAEVHVRERVVHRRRVVVIDPLIVEGEQPFLCRRERCADRPRRRDVEPALLREQPLVLVEIAHADLARILGAERELVAELAHPADAHADAPRIVVTVVRNVAGRASRRPDCRTVAGLRP